MLKAINFSFARKQNVNFLVSNRETFTFIEVVPGVSLLECESNPYNNKPLWVFMVESAV